MEKPSSIATRRVAVQYVIGAVDGPDADDEPDFIPARGVVEFTASVAYTPWPEVSGPNPMTVLNAKITGVLDDEGYLCTPHPSNPTLPGKRGVRLLCTDGSGGSVKEWTWTAAPKFVDANGTRIPDVIPPFSFYLPSDPDPNAPDLDLTTVVKVPASQGTGTAQAEALAALASAAAASSANSAETAVAAALDIKRRADAGEFKGEPGEAGAPGPNTVPTQEAVAGYMKTPGNPAREAVGVALATRTASQKAVGEPITALDLLRAAKWSSESNFLIPLPDSADIAEGSEFTLLAEGKGAGRIVPAEENLFPYPDASAGYSGGIWQARGTSNISIAAGVAPGGQDAIRVTATGATSSGGFGHNGHATATWLISDLGLSAGDTISARAWLAPPTGQNGRIQVRFYRGATTLAEPATTGTPGVGVRHVNGVTIPAETTHIAILSYTTAPAAGATCDIAQVRIARGSGPATSYIDGNAEGAMWWGIPHQSPSSVGRVIGDAVVPPGGRTLLRYEGTGLWRAVPVSTGVDVLRRTDTLAMDRDNGQQGMLVPSAQHTVADGPLVPGRTYVSRVVPSRDMLIQGIGFRLVGAASTDEPCSVGIFSAAGARLVSSGAVSGQLLAPVGTKTISIPPTLLKAGMVYYVGFSSSSSATVRRGVVLADAYGTALPAIEAGYLTGHPLPASLPAVTADDAAFMFVLREFP